MVATSASPRAPPGKVRIIGGQWRRRWLPVTAVDAVRPTPDRVRETLFNWLQPYLAGARCLDLFAGTGVLGFEAVSRGAAQAMLIENDAQTAATLRAQVAAFKTTSVEVLNMDARSYLSATLPRVYDIVFLDPPFDSPLLTATLSLLEAGWLHPEALIYIESARAANAVTLPSGWRMMHAGQTRQIRYGLAQLTFEP
ncbi:MAG: 16S rRNA (guanine(966)-N(2))-methyltransferase RsmD [Gammaproteobacteria bacterium]|nr:16S rRNA (guanine(966)-N(2))-methyltransferase RsmD [Gammaproteobacteria bacterium]